MHRLEENKEEITDDLVTSFIKDKMEIELSANEIDRSHKIGKPSPWKKRHIIIKFVHTTIKETFSQTKKNERLWNIYYRELNCAPDGGA